MDNQLQNNGLPAIGLQARVAAALQSARAIDAPLCKLEYVLAQAMAKAFADMGQKVTDRNDEITYLVQNMPAEVTLNLPGIRIDEIPIAINRGILHHFGDFYGLNVASFMRFLTAHYQCSLRANAIKKLAAPVAEPLRPSPAQLLQIRTNRIATAFAKYKADGYYNDYGNLVFDSINAMGKIPFGEEKEMQLLEQARQNLIKTYSRSTIYPADRAKLKAGLNKLLSGNGQTLIVAEAKRLTLFALFDYLIEKNIDIMAFLEK